MTSEIFKNPKLRGIELLKEHAKAQRELASLRSPSIHFAIHLKETRLSKGLTLRGLSDLSGISFSAIHLIEKGKTSPSLDTIIKLADALSCKLKIELCAKNI